MLTEVKNQIKVTFLSIKYALMREMINKTTFITNILFMILNNASFIIQWIILYSLKDNVGGYSLKEVLLLWGISASSYGFSHFFFEKAHDLSNTINKGKLDTFLVQPKNVLLSSITSEIKTSAIGDIIYGYIMLFIYGINISNFILFTFFTITGGLITTSLTIILSSLSFWFNNSEMLADIGNSLMLNVSLYPDGIFKGIVKILLYTIIPAGFAYYMPIKIITDFNIYLFLVIILFTLLIIFISYLIFYKGLKKYSSSNLMIARI